MMRKLLPVLFLAFALAVAGCGDSSSELDNKKPIADAGPDQTVAAGEAVNLDGGGSSDPEGRVLSFLWAFTAKPLGSEATLSDPTAVQPTFVADLAGEYIVALVVHDGEDPSAPDSVIVTAEEGDLPPVADAGPDQGVLVGANVGLDGGDSFDPNGDPLSYAWTLESKPGGSAAVLADDDTQTPSFTADLAGAYVVSLVVEANGSSSAPDFVTVTASTDNIAPVADAGEDQTVLTETLVLLSGAGSFDPNGDDLTYSWVFLAKPVGSAAVFSNGTAEAPTFTPDLKGDYLVQLTVSDGALIDTDTVLVTAVAIDFLADIVPIFEQGCVPGCHVEGGQSDDILDHGSTKNPLWLDAEHAYVHLMGEDGLGVYSVKDPEVLRVKPFDPQHSMLLLRVTGEVTPRMPLTGNAKDELEDLLRQWIQEGALLFL